MPACVLCGEDTFDEFDGNFFCVNCGTQTQELRTEAAVEADTDNLGFGHSQQREIVSKRRKSARRSKYPDTDFGKPWLTYEAIQCLLKAQIKALVDFGVNSTLKDVVRQIWFHFLRKKKVAFTGAREGSSLATELMKVGRDINLGLTPSSSIKKKEDDDDIKDVKVATESEMEQNRNNPNKFEEDLSNDSFNEESSCSDSDEYSSESDEEGDNPKEHIGSLRYKLENSNTNWTVLQHKHSVVFLYIGLLYLKEPITIADILRLITRGHIPYHRMSTVLPDHMKFSKEDISTFSYRPLRASKIHEGTNFLMNYLDLPEVPAPDFHLMIAKLILDFQLPAAIHRLTVSLVKACSFEPRTIFNFPRRVNCNEYYEEMAVAFIIVAIKLVYGLDGETEKNGEILTKHLDVPVEEIDCWNCVVLRLEKKKQNDVLSNYPTCANDLAYVTSCQDYALYCAEEVFRGATRKFASRQHLNRTHCQYQALMNDAKEEYCGIMNEAVKDLEHGKPKEYIKLSSSSFVYDRISRATATDVSCKCHEKKMAAFSDSSINAKKRLNAMEPKLDNNNKADAKESKLGQKSKLSSRHSESYLIYLNDLSGLRVHDSYRFLLDVFSRRILIRPFELHEFVTYVETMLFVDPNL